MKKTWDAFWSKKDHSSKVWFVVGCGWWLFALVYSVLTLASPELFPNTPLNESLKVIGVTLQGTWENILPRLLACLFYLTFITLVCRILRLILDSLPIANHKAKTVEKLVSSFIKYAGMIVFVVLVLAAWGVDTTALFVSAGVVVLIIGLGAQSLIGDILAGLNIVFEDEYHVGDIVVIDDFRGTVEEIGLTTTKLSDAAGNIKVINNSKVSTMVNLSARPSVASCLMYVDYDADLEAVEKMVSEHLEEIGKKIPTALDTPRYLGVSDLADSGIELKFICHCAESDIYATQRALNREFVLLFLKNGIDYPYNQLMLSSRELAHPNDAANPEQFQKILDRLGKDPNDK